MAQPDKVAKRRAVAGAPLHLWETVLDCSDVGVVGRFYAELLEVPLVQRNAEWAYVEPALRGAGVNVGGRHPRGGVRLAFQRVPEPNPGKARLHLDIGSFDLAADAARAVALGGQQLGPLVADESGPFIVMADPEGHEFCLVSP